MAVERGCFINTLHSEQQQLAAMLLHFVIRDLDL